MVHTPVPTSQYQAAQSKGVDAFVQALLQAPGDDVLRVTVGCPLAPQQSLKPLRGRERNSETSRLSVGDGLVASKVKDTAGSALPFRLPGSKREYALREMEGFPPAAEVSAKSSTSKRERGYEPL